MADRSRDDIWIIGVSMTRFGRYPGITPFELGAEAAFAALGDADVSIDDIEVIAAGNVEQARENAAQRIQDLIGKRGIPAFNVLNACATGATAVRVVHQALKAGEASIGLAVGCESMGKQGLLGRTGELPDTFEPRGLRGEVMPTQDILGTATLPGVFAMAGMTYAGQHDGVGFEQFARVAVKNHEHSTLNPLALYQQAYTLDEIMHAEMISYPNTLLMCCPTGDGAAAAVLVTAERLRSMPREVQRRAVKISASVLAAEPYTEAGSAEHDVSEGTRIAARRAYEQAGVAPGDLDLVELHDCFATAELLHYDNLGLCEPGGAGDFIDRRGPWRDGEIPVNVSGGLISKGHPLSATGIANIFEVVTHLRGEAGARQIDGARVGLTHVIGLRAAAVVHILEKGALV